MSVTSTMTESLRMVRNQENFCSIGWELGVCCLVSGPVAGFAGAGIPDTISCAALIDKVFLLLFVHKKKILPPLQLAHTAQQAQPSAPQKDLRSAIGSRLDQAVA